MGFHSILRPVSYTHLDVYKRQYMWSKPWSYKEGRVIGAGLLVIGALLQMSVGTINWSLFALSLIHIFFNTRDKRVFLFLIGFL